MNANAHHPSRDRRDAKLAAWLVLAAIVAAPAAAGRLRAEPPSATVDLLEGSEVGLSLQLAEPDGRPREGLSFLAESNFGSVGAVEEVEPGRYAATLRLPPTDMPRAAVVVLSAQDSDRLELHHAVVPVTVRTHLRARTEPRSKVSVQVGDRQHGPVTAGRTGWFTIAFEQPLGTESAEVVLVDTAGNVSRQLLPVPRRPHDALSVALDRYRATTDGLGRVRVHALVFDELGRPVRGARIEASADRGTLGDFTDHGDGVHSASWTAPADGSEGVAVLRVRVRQGGTVHEETERIRLERGAPGRLQLTAEPTELVAGERSDVRLGLLVQDAAGHGLSKQAVRLTADRGSLDALREVATGRYESRLLLPEDVGSGSIEVKAVLATGAPPSPPTRMLVTANPEVVPTSWRAFSLVTAQLTDAAGRPVAGEVVLFHVTRGEGTVTPAAVTNADGRAFADFSADPTEEVVVVEAVATTTPSLKGDTRIEKKADGEFVLLNRPALAAQGGGAGGLIALGDGERVLQDSVLITLRPGAPAALSLEADPPRLVADGRSSSRVTARLTDARGNEIPGARLSFGTDVGTVGEGSNVGDGRYLAVFTSPEGAGEGRAVVTATEPESGLGASTTIELEVGPPASLELLSDRDELPADGTSTARLTATVLDASGVPVPGATLRFRPQGPEVELAAEARTGSDGRAELTLTAGEEAGALLVVAETVEGLSAEAAIELLPIDPVDLVLRATPDSILANGLDSSELEATLEDALGRPVADHRVEFRVLDGPGVVPSAPVRTDALGVARVRLTGTRAGTARVRARSTTASALQEVVSVELRPAALVAAFEVESPACAGRVRLTGTGDESLVHEWDWTGDGVADATGIEVTAPLSAGSREVRLTVRDDAGGTASSTQSFPVAPAPVAVATADATHVATGGCTRLDGAGSVATGGGALSWSWDLDGDGLEDADTPTVPEWCAPDGEQRALLRVTEAGTCSTTDEVVVVFGETPVLTVALSTPGVAPPVTAGSTFEVELRWGNAGRAPAPDVRLDVQLSGELSLDGALPAGGEDLGGGLLRFSLGELASGANGSFRLPVRATEEPDLPRSQARVEASARYRTPTGQSPPAGAALSLPIVPAVGLRLQCEAPGTAKPGEEWVWLARLRNDGVSPAHDTQLDLSWDDVQLELLGSTPAGSGTSDSLRLDWVRLEAGEEVTAQLRFRVRSVLPTADNLLELGAVAAHSGVDLDPSDDACSRLVSVTAEPDAWVSLRATPEKVPARTGDTILYELRYGNRGSTAAEGTVLEGRFEAGVFTSSLVENPDAGVYSSGDGTIRFLAGLLPVDPTGQRELRWRVRVDDGLPAGPSTVRTEVTVRHAGTDATPTDDQDAVTVSLESAPDVSLEATLPATAAAGSSVPIVLRVHSTGDVPAEGVVIDHVFGGARAQVVLASLPPSATVLPSGGVRFALGDLNVGDSRTLSYELRLEARQDEIDPTLANDWTARFGDPPAPRSRSLLRDLFVAAGSSLSVQVQPSVAEAAAGERLDVLVRLAASGAAPWPAGTLDLSWAPEHFLGAPPTGLPFSAVDPGSSRVLGPFTLDVQPVLPATRSSAPVSAVVTGSAAGGSASVTLTAAPELELRIASLAASAEAGEWVDVEVAHRNVGSTAATAVELELLDDDALDLLVAERSAANLGRLPADGVERTELLRFRVKDALPSCSSPLALRPSASFAESPAGVAGAPSSLDLLGTPDLRLALGATPSADPPGPGDFIAYDIELTNDGSAPAVSPQVLVERDAALLPDALPPLPAGAVVSPSQVVVPWPDLAPGASAVRTLRLRVADSLPQPTNRAEVTAEGSEASCEADTANNFVEVGLNVGAVADVVVAMDVRTDPAELQAGGSVGVTLYLHDAGTTAANDVALEFEYPPELVARVVGDGGADAVSPGRLSWTGRSLTPGDAPQRFDVSLEAVEELPATTNLFSLSARASTSSPENLLDNNSVETTRSVRGWADLCVELSAAPEPAPATAAGRVEYTVRVENRGTTAARATVLRLDYDATLLSPQGGGPDPHEWSVGDLAPGASVDFAATFSIAPSVPGGTAIAEATAVATSAEHDAWGLAACEARADHSLVITEDADLALGLTLRPLDPNPVRDDLVELTLAVENIGNADADLGGPAVGLVEAEVPAGLLLDSPGGGSWNGSALQWDLPPRLRRGDAWTATYRLRIDPALPAGIHRLTSLARVFPAGPDATPMNDADSETLELRFDVDLETTVRCTPVPAPAVPGSTLEYEVQVLNRGAQPASNVLLEVDGGGIVLLDAPLSGGSAVVPGPASLPSGGTWTFRFTGRSLDALPDQWTVVSLTAEATADEADAEPANDVATTSCNVLASVDLRAQLQVSEVDASPPVEAGEELDVSVTAANVGSRIESGVELVLEFDPQLAEFVSGASFLPDGAGRLRHVHPGSWDPRDPAEVLDLRLRSAAVLPTPLEVLTVCAALSSPGPEAFPADNRACRSLQLFAAPDLRIDRTVTSPTDPALPGQVLDHQARVENVGTTIAHGAALEHVREASRTTGLVPGSASHPAVESGDRIRFELGDLAPGEVALVSYGVALDAVQPTVAGAASSEACALLDETDADPTDNCQTRSVDVLAPPDAWVELRLEPAGPLDAGAATTAVLDYGNRGSSPLTATELSLEIDAALLFAATGASGTWTSSGLPSVAPGESRQERIPLRVADELSAPLVLGDVRGAIGHASLAQDANVADNVSEVAVQLQGTVDLVAEAELLSPAEPEPGDSLSYELRWRNDGSAPATNALLTLVPDPLLLAPGGGTATSPDPRPLGDLAPGASGSLTVEYELPTVLPADTTVVELIGTLSSDVPDATPSDDTALVAHEIQATADVRALSLDVVATPAPPQAGGLLELTALFDNHGSTAARGATLTFRWDEALAVLVDAGGGTPLGTDGVSFSLGDLPVSSGAPESAGITLRARSVLPELTNRLLLSAEIAADNEDATLDGDNGAVQYPNVLAEPDLVAQVRIETAPPLGCGTTVSAVAGLLNTGSTLAQGATLTLSWDEALVATVVDSGGAGSVGAGSASWTLGDALPGTPPMERRVVLRLADTLPAASDTLTLGAQVASVDSDADVSNNSASAGISVEGTVDLGLTVRVEPAGTFGDGDFVYYTYEMRNQGCSPAVDPCVEAAYDPSVLTHWRGGVDLGGTVQTCMDDTLAPGGWDRRRTVTFQVHESGTGEVRREIPRTHATFQTGLTPADDANPADNVVNTQVTACFLEVGIQSPSPSDTCMGSSLTLVADTSPNEGLSHEWTAPNGGSFDDPTAPVVVFTPPAVAGLYPVHLRVTHPSGCSVSTEDDNQFFPVRVVADCSSCGCHPANLKLVYVDGTLERADSPGSRDVAAGESVAFRLSVNDTGTGKSATIRTGTTLSFTDGAGQVYSARLAYPVFYECRTTVTLEFETSEVPAAMLEGDHAPNLLVDAIDACGNGSPRDTNVTNDVHVSPPLGNALDPAIDFRDWGPRRTGR